MIHLDARSPVPLYHQLKEQLKAEILAGHRSIGDQLPSERDLADQLTISRMTARQALAELEREGFLVRQQGKGSFIAMPDGLMGISRLGFTQDVINRGHRPGSRVISALQLPADTELAGDLMINIGEPVWRMERVRTVDGVAVCFQVIFLPLTRFPDLIQVDLNSRSLYGFLRERYGLEVRTGRRTVESVASGSPESGLLGLAPSSPLLRISGVALDQDGRPVECGWSLYRTDRYKLAVEMV